ncbi:MAG TPA: discoidin domain-containing protein [Polyangiaceae bacterium]|nr:discoidin domain-containing protein [Polyangiaceae bacterium]
MSKRLVEWFWRGSAIGEWQRSSPLFRDRSLEFAARSELSAELARFVLASAEPLAGAVGCELYRQASYWELSALGSVNQPQSTESAHVWEGLTDELLLPLAANVEDRQQLRARLSSGNFVTFAEMPAKEQVTNIAVLQELHAALKARFTERQRGLLTLRRQRAFRLGGLLACLLGVLLGITIVRARTARAGDLAYGAPWRASSAYPGGGGCFSPDQECDDKTGWFFHTADSDTAPWIEFDLGSAKSVSKVVIVNRDDCCAERAVPMVVEVSLDQAEFRTVAEQREQFTTWRVTFPQTRARWLRLRLLDRGPFHLKNVRIFP